jgi:hypothetical protein
MSVQRYMRGDRVRYRARVKSHGREVATRVFNRKSDAVAWEQDQTRKLRLGEWIDPRRGRLPLSAIADDWLQSRNSLKRRAREAYEADWRLHVKPQFGNRPVASITTADHDCRRGQLGRRDGRAWPSPIECRALPRDASLDPRTRGRRWPSHHERSFQRQRSE